MNEMTGIFQINIQLVSGAIGGNAAGMAMPKPSLDSIGNSIAGIVGGGLGGQLLGLLGIGVSTGGGISLESIIASVLGGGVGGGALMAIAGAIKNAVSRK